MPKDYAIDLLNTLDQAREIKESIPEVQLIKCTAVSLDKKEAEFLCEGVAYRYPIDAVITKAVHEALAEGMTEFIGVPTRDYQTIYVFGEVYRG